MLAVTTHGGIVELSGKLVDELRRSLSGPVLLQEDPGYDEARRVWNRMIDRQPALVARCTSAEDVVNAVSFARAHELLISVRGGGHNVSGSAVCPAGLMLDLSPMKAARVDGDRRLVSAEPGLTWGELDGATQRLGLATTGGIVSTTGVAGLTLGGGHGWLARRHGLTCDNLASVRLVSADGRLVRASAEENAELFWAVRGGGGNFGIVTSFEFRLHPLTAVVGGLLLYPMARAADVLRCYRDCATAAPDDLTLYVIITVWYDGAPVIAVVPCYSGPPGQAEVLLRPLRRLGPTLDTVRPLTYGELQTMFDATNPPGAWYYKSGYLDGGHIQDEPFSEVLLAHCDFPSPSPLSRIVIEQLGGAVASVNPEETAFTHRHDPFNLIVIAGGFRPEEAPANIRWARATWAALRPFMSGGVYVNYLAGDEGAEGVREAYGATYARLARVKQRWDPGNVFRLNQNVGPGGDGPPG